MKATGVTRGLDSLGRVTIPKELRRSYNLPEGAVMEFFTDNAGNIILRKYTPECAICGVIDGVQQVNGVRLCPACLARVADRLPRKGMMANEDAAG